MYLNHNRKRRRCLDAPGSKSLAATVHIGTYMILTHPYCLGIHWEFQNPHIRFRLLPAHTGKHSRQCSQPYPNSLAIPGCRRFAFSLSAEIRAHRFYKSPRTFTAYLQSNCSGINVNIGYKSTTSSVTLQIPCCSANRKFTLYRGIR